MFVHPWCNTIKSIASVNESFFLGLESETYILKWDGTTKLSSIEFRERPSFLLFGLHGCMPATINEPVIVAVPSALRTEFGCSCLACLFINRRPWIHVISVLTATGDMDEEFYFDITEYLKMYGLNQTGNMTDFGFIDHMPIHPANHISLLVVMCLGLLANSLSTFVWIKDVKVKSGVFFLVCLSIADGLYCFAGILVKCVELSDNGWICNPFIGLSMIFAYASRLLTVAVVAQRWLAVSRPLSLPNLCSFSRQVAILVCLLVSLIGLIAMEIYNEVNYCEGITYSLRWMKWMNVYLVIVFTWNAITFVCLVVFNILLMIATCSIRKNLTGSVIGSQQRQLEFHMTIIIFCASALSFADLVSFLLLTLSSLEHIELHETSWKIANDWISLVNSSVNFVFYVLFGRDFRKSLRRMGRHLVVRVTRQRRNSSRKSSQRSTESSVHYMTKGLSANPVE